MAEWILLERLSEGPPTVICLGRKPRKRKRLDDVIRGPRRQAIRTAVAAVLTSKTGVDRTYANEGFRVVAEPFLSPLDRVNAVRVCAVGYDEELPERLPTGAWAWDLNKATVLPSDAVLDVYRMPQDKRLGEITRLQGMFGVTTAAARQAELLGKALTGEHGTEVSEIWQIQRYDDVLRDMCFAACVEEVDGQRWLHGVTCDITVGESAIAPPLSFAESVVEAELAAQVGAHSMLMDIRTLTAIRWLSAPLEVVQDRSTGDPDRDPAIHPDDILAAQAIARSIATAPAEGRVRVRSVDGGWVGLHVTATLMHLDHENGAQAALVKIRLDT